MRERRPAQAYDYVTEKRMGFLLSEWAKAADAAMTAKVNEMEARLRLELGACETAPPAETPSDV